MLPSKGHGLLVGRSALLLTVLVFATVLTLVFLFSSPNQFYIKFASLPSLHGKDDKCDFFHGHWIRDDNGSSLRYTNSSCATIPDKKNCFRHGRMDTEFLKWRWKPARCDLPGFDADVFLQIVRGKTMGFVGDSVGRNHMDSLLCLLSPTEAAVDIYKDAKDRNRIYHFPDHNFTLRAIWTKFLVTGEERVVNGSLAGVVDLRLDQVDDNWAKELPTLDMLIISTGQWFFRPMYLHEGANMIACVHCEDPQVSARRVDFAIQKTIRAALTHINRCENCSHGLITLLRTYSPSHFDNGGWNTGGTCNRTAPLMEEEITSGGVVWEIRNVQAQEIGRMTKLRRPGMSFGLLDVTRAMLMRPDGHPGPFWRDKKKGSNDCVHWCLPGPVDLWSHLLFALLRQSH